MLGTLPCPRSRYCSLNTPLPWPRSHASILNKYIHCCRYHSPEYEKDHIFCEQQLCVSSVCLDGSSVLLKQYWKPIWTANPCGIWMKTHEHYTTATKPFSALQGTTRPVVRGSVIQTARSFNKLRFEEPLGHQRRDSFFT